MDFEAKSPEFMDNANFTYDVLSGLDYVQYPGEHSPYMGIQMGRKSSYSRSRSHLS
jgi:hypothetical protein